MNEDTRRNIAKLRIAAKQLTKERTYWMSRLRPGFSKVTIPNEGTSTGELKYDSVTIRLENAVATKVASIAGNSDYTLHAFLMLSVHLFLHKSTGEADFCIGTPTISRDQRTADTLNKFIAVREAIVNDEKLVDLLKRYAANFKNDVDHQNYPFEVLKETLDYSTDDLNPFFDCIVAFSSIQDTTSLHDSGASLAFIFSKEAASLSLRISYPVGVYQENSIQQILKTYARLLENITTSLTDNVDALKLMRPADEQALVCELNKKLGKNRPGKSVVQLFEEQVQEKGSSVAISHASQTITYGALHQAVTSIATSLKKAGVTTGSRVGVMMNSSINMVASILGILKAGAAYVPIDEGYPVNRKKYIVQASGLKTVVVSRASDNEELYDVLGETVPAFVEDLIENADTFQGPAPDMADTAYVIYTSGTTGNPKGVMISHYNLSNYLYWAKGVYAKGESNFALFTSISFDLTITSLFVPLISGNTIRIYSNRHPESALQEILKENIVHVIKLTPSHLKIIDALPLYVPIHELRLKTIIVGGENLERTLADSISRKFKDAVTILNEYGPTEATVGCMIHAYDGKKDLRRSVPIGQASDNNAIYLLDECGNLVPSGVIGEIFISGQSVSAGYLGNKEATDDRFIESPFREGERLYKTGDLAIRLANGNLEYLGRKDSQVKIQGYRIELDEIKSCLNKITGIQNSIVLARDNKGTGAKFLCAYYVSDLVLSSEAIDAALKKQLPQYMIPQHVIKIASIPLTENGKIDLKALPEPFSTGERKVIEPRNALEKTLVDVLKNILKAETISMDDNIFKLGVDSIRTIQFAALLGKQLSMRIEVPEFYEYPVLQDLATHLAKKLEQKESLDIKKIQKNQVLSYIGDFQKESKARLPQHVALENVEETYPMSEIEKAMLYYSAAFKESPLYLEQNLYNINYVNFDFQLFEKVVHALIVKHGTLRSGFDVPNSIHIVYKQFVPSITVFDISQDDVRKQQTFIDEIRLRDRSVKIDFVKPTLQFTFFKIQYEQYIMLLQFHHAVMDGWSLHAFLVELNNTYVEAVKNRAYTPAPLKCSYIDNITEELINKRNDAATQYWQKELEEHKRFVFPKPTSNQNAKNAILIHETRGVDYISKLQTFCDTNQVTLRNLCMAAYVYTLNTVSYDSDILVGHVTNTRPVCEDGEKLLGCFLNTIPFRVKVAPTQRAIDFVKNIHEKLSLQKRFEGLALLDIKDKVGEKSTNQNPFFDTKFNFIDFHVIHDMNKYEIERKEGREFYLPNFTIENTHCDFCIDLTGNKKFFASWVYSPDFVDQETAGSLLATYMKILDFFVDYPHEIIRKNVFMDSETKNRILNQFNATEAEYPKEMGVMHLFESQVANTPDRVALRSANEVFTYKELNERANRLARVLRKKGVKKGDIVPIHLKRSSDMILAIYAILKAQAAYLPVSGSYPKGRIDFILNDSKANILITDSTDVVEQHREHAVLIADLMALHERGENLDLPYDPCEKAYVIYTSGSTGNPKGVIIEHMALVNRLIWMRDSYAIAKDDCILQKTVYTFDVSVWELFLAGIAGASLCLLEVDGERTPAKIVEAIEQFGITTLHFVPSMFSAFINYVKEFDVAYKLHSLKWIFTSGEALPAVQVNSFNELFARHPEMQLVNLYGPTEATVDVTYYNCTRAYATSIPIGKPISNTRMYVLDAHHEALPIGAVGELYIAGDGLARGYLNKPALTKDRFFSNPLRPSELIYKTGDLARWLPDGNIEYCGRCDAQVKIRGFRIELGEIEYQVSRMPGIKESVVVCRENESGKYLWAYYVSDEKQQDGFFRTELMKYLPEYMIPAYFIQLNSIPVTSNGKIDYKELPADRIWKSTEIAQPHNAVEQQLLSIFAQVVGANPTTISIDDNFFEVGGNSINMLQMSLKVGSAYSIEIPVNVLFTFSTIRTLANYLKQETAQDVSVSRQADDSLSVLDETMEILNDDER